jgi:hypothetical protein
VTVAVLASSTPESTLAPSDTPTASPFTGERKQVAGFFSFITPLNYHADLEERAAFVSDLDQEVFLSLAIIGEGEDERTVQELVDDIFEGFDGVEVKDPETYTIDSLTGQRAEFSGVTSGGVVSGYYVIIDLGNEISFLAFGMGKVTESTDSWLQYGELNFTQLLETVDILFGSTF